MTVTTIIRDVVYEQRIVAIECASCSVDFGIGAKFMANRREDHERFYCPNGHPNVYLGKTALERERDRLANQLRWTDESLDALRTVAKAADYRARAAKGQLTKYRRRLEAGLCPVASCRRSFSSLRDHIATVHPDVAARLED